MKALKEAAKRCPTPKQFRNLLQQHLRRFVPYDKFAGTWGNPTKHRMSYIFVANLPGDFLRWYLTTGAQWKSPTMQEWVRNQGTYIWLGQARKLKVDKTNPELFRRVHASGMTYTLTGGRVSQTHYIAFHAGHAVRRKCSQPSPDLRRTPPVDR